jgi:hypothetical protein
LRRANNLVGGPSADPDCGFATYNQKAVLTEFQQPEGLLFFSIIVRFDVFMSAGILVKGKI